MSDITKWDPFEHVTRLYEDMDNLFTEFLNNFSQEFQNVKVSNSSMNLNVTAKGNEIVITANIPNIVKDSINVALRPDSVIVSGESSYKKEQEGSQELSWSKFTRMCALPVKVRSEEAKVTTDNGKLVIRVPKAK